MKNFFLTVFCLALVGTSLYAQKLPKSVKDAKKAFNAKDFAGALDLINAGLKDDATANMAEAWSVKGDVYTAMMSEDFNNITLAAAKGESAAVKYPTAGKDAFDAYEKALGVSTGEKDKGQKAAMAGLVNLTTKADQIGSALYSSSNFEGAFNSFDLVFKAKDLLDSKGNKSTTLDAASAQGLKYNAILSAINAKKPTMAKGYMEQLVNEGFNKPLPYTQLFDLTIKEDEAAAFAILDKGKKACEGDVASFLFSEINYHLQKGEYEKLEGKLQSAIKAEPDNVSLYFALGTVYDKFYQESYQAGDKAKGDEHFEKAKKYYNEALIRKEDFSDAMFNMGAMYFNKAAYMNDEIAKYDSDMTSAGLRKYEELRGKQKGFMNEAKPYFVKTLAMDGNHIGAAGALKSIAANNNDAAELKKYTDLYNKLTGK